MVFHSLLVCGDNFLYFLAYALHIGSSGTDYRNGIANNELF